MLLLCASPINWRMYLRWLGSGSLEPRFKILGQRHRRGAFISVRPRLNQVALFTWRHKSTARFRDGVRRYWLPHIPMCMLRVLCSGLPPPPTPKPLATISVAMIFMGIDHALLADEIRARRLQYQRSCRAT
jgi:hypothetical protein